jgi:hypothetical protein
MIGEPWELQAACANHDPDLWFRADTDEAARICAECPVAVQCASRAETVAANAGVWAGVARDSERTGGTRVPPVHGTEARAKWDRRRNINPCTLCKEAAARAHRERKNRRAFNPAPEKRCKACGIVKPNTEFHREIARPDGLTPLCKPCKSEHYRNWYRTKGRADRGRGAA